MTDELLTVLVEIPRGSQNKYEYDFERKAIRLDRVLYSSVHYPTDYGFIEDTLADDGDHLDALLLADQPTFPGCIVRARAVAVLHMEDYNGLDHKILCACADDPRQDDVCDLDSVPKHLLTEIENFFEIYKTLEVDKPTTLRGWGPRKVALEIVRNAQEAFRTSS
jgi:inorganic pyrophosphatase